MQSPQIQPPTIFFLDAPLRQRNGSVERGCRCRKIEHPPEMEYPLKLKVDIKHGLLMLKPCMQSNSLKTLLRTSAIMYLRRPLLICRPQFEKNNTCFICVVVCFLIPISASIINYTHSKEGKHDI